MTTRDIRVSTWAELQERLYEESWQEPLGRFRSTFAYRGQTSAAADLTTSLKRLIHLIWRTWRVTCTNWS